MGLIIVGAVLVAAFIFLVLLADDVPEDYKW